MTCQQIIFLAESNVTKLLQRDLPRRICVVGISVILGFLHPVYAQAIPVDTKSLPPEEQTLLNTVDHWGLPFSDQLRRFTAGVDQFKDELKEKTPQNYIVGIQHGLEKIPLNKYWFKGEYTSQVSIAAAINEYENFQVAVLPHLGKTLKNVTLQAGALQNQAAQYLIPEDKIKIYRVAYVKTEQAGYPSLYTGLWPDPLLPNDAISISGTDLGLFWVEVKVPQDAPAGNYHGVLNLNADGETVNITVSLKVYAFTLPDRVEFPVGVWTSRSLPSKEAMDLESYRQLWGMLLEHSIDPLSVGKEYFSFDQMDFQVLDENIAYCLKRGLQIFEIPKAETHKLKPLVDHLRQKGFLEKALIYSNIDEPDADYFKRGNIPFYSKIHQAFPDLRVFLATEYHPDIDKGCDIWLNDLSTGKGIEFALQNKGQAELWTYYCHLPIHADFNRPLVQAPNMLIDCEAIEHRLAFWLAWKYNIKGMFIWSGNNEWVKDGIAQDHWEKTGWKLSPSETPSKYPYAGIHNGNGYLIYPGPYLSMRMKILRDGMEDLAYLKILDSAAANVKNEDIKQRARRILSVSHQLVVDPHYFNRDPSVLLAERKQVAQMIEQITREQ